MDSERFDLLAQGHRQSCARNCLGGFTGVLGGDSQLSCRSLHVQPLQHDRRVAAACHRVPAASVARPAIQGNIEQGRAPVDGHDLAHAAGAADFGVPRIAGSRTLCRHRMGPDSQPAAFGLHRCGCRGFESNRAVSLQHFVVQDPVCKGRRDAGPFRLEQGAPSDHSQTTGPADCRWGADSICGGTVLWLTTSRIP